MPRDCGRSGLVRPGQQRRTDERLLLKAANWRCRPRADLRVLEFVALKPSVRSKRHIEGDPAAKRTHRVALEHRSPVVQAAGVGGQAVGQCLCGCAV